MLSDGFRAISGPTKTAKIGTDSLLYRYSLFGGRKRGYQEYGLKVDMNNKYDTYKYTIPGRSEIVDSETQLISLWSSCLKEKR